MDLNSVKEGLLMLTKSQQFSIQEGNENDTFIAYITFNNFKYEFRFKFEFKSDMKDQRVLSSIQYLSRVANKYSEGFVNALYSTIEKEFEEKVETKEKNFTMTKHGDEFTLSCDGNLISKDYSKEDLKNLVKVISGLIRI